MITLATGLPGAGKTLYTLTRVKEQSEREGRAVFYSGIKDLTLPWVEIDPEAWPDVPEGAIVVIDEAQRIFRPRGNGAQVPAFVSALETHRHRGLDLFLVTQHPMLIDANVRRLTERHFHLSRRFGLQRATVLEFESCKDQPLAKLAGAQRSEWAYPRAIYDFYKSAEVHTVKRRLPTQLWVLLAMLALVAAAVWWFVRSHYRDGQILLPGQSPSGAVVVQEASGLPGGGAGAREIPVRAKGETARPALSPLEYVIAHQPRVPGLAYTAPVYDEVTRPVVAPIPVGAVRFRGQCRAYSQQGTRLDMSEELCSNLLERGFFRSFLEARHPEPSTTPREKIGGEAAAGVESRVMSGQTASGAEIVRGLGPSTGFSRVPSPAADGSPTIAPTQIVRAPPGRQR